MKSYNNLYFGGDEIQTENMDDAKIVILPVCFENSPSYGSGAKNGPIYFLKASEQLERIDEENFFDWGSLKIHTRKPVFPDKDPAFAVKYIQEEAKKIFKKNKKLLTVGGDHSVAIGSVLAASQHFPDVCVVQIDAHLDLRDEWGGSKYNHACVMRRIIEDAKTPVVHVGIRSFSPEELVYIKKNNIKPYFAHDIDLNNNSWINEIIDKLPLNVYLTLDLDGLDPSVIPGTGTPEPGGLMYRQVVQLIREIGIKRNLIGADICELAKIEGSQVSEFTAAKLATKIFQAF